MSVEKKQKNKLTKFLSQIAFPILGLSSLLWFIIRVIPKPSRAGYPCMKVAAPLASSFITYVLGMAVTVVAFKKVRRHLDNARYVVAGAFLFVGLCAGVFMITQMDTPIRAGIVYFYDHPANDPIGEAQGIFPGRVVWAWNPDATNENQTGTDDGQREVTENDDYYFLKKNNDQDVIDDMVQDVIVNLTGETTLADAWDAMFKYHNNKKTGIDTTYTPGEKIFIKINATSILQGDGGQNWHTWDNKDLTKLKPGWWEHPDVVETTPQVVLSVLRQLINEAGVRQRDIYVGDPLKNVYKHLFEMWKGEFPDINVLGNDIYFNGLDLIALDRVPLVKSDDDLLFYSDKGTIMDEAVKDKLYTIHEQAAYMINIASLKAHACAGITLCAKNHFGSHSRSSANHLHKGIVGEENDKPYRTDYGMYRVQVDIMGHELLGGNTMLFMVDGLYSAVEGWTDAYPVKWEMAPFNNDFTNSIFASLDGVAIESVCFDFLRTEYDGPEVEWNRPNMGGVDDYLQQAANSQNWPVGIIYDPENDGTPISSLGVHEHWNNATEKQYSRNLGTGDGIELIKVFEPTTVEQHDDAVQPTFHLKPNYPNPFNASTTISYELESNSHVQLNIYNVQGQKVRALVHEQQVAGLYDIKWHGMFDNGKPAPSGTFLIRLTVTNEHGTLTASRKMTFLK